MTRVRFIVVCTSSLLSALAACGTDGGGSTSDATTSPDVTVPAEYPQLGAGEAIKVVGTLDGTAVSLVNDDPLARGYLPTYGILADDVGSDSSMSVFGLWSLAVGTYSYPGLTVGFEQGDDLWLSTVCEDSLPTLEIVGGGAPGIIWGTLSATVCKTGRTASFSAHFTANARESVAPGAGSCSGSPYCDFAATSDFGCTNDAPGCTWKSSICLGASDHPECRDWDGGSMSTCESHTPCVYFAATCEGDLVIPCDTLETELGCKAIKGCFWLAD